ncbi:hypothetical protein CC85DRAFT_291736 [Cutaneotrichosporon oleaginosum]|uniref:Uncharacterized protein n=1 Tax=Cutaneotrichosporon oleaginosum TaxID=879819 RepID=A0A0J1B5Y6_9TREE|nr:uncharacterized protein CC85DRAFT_291736 [Cutaneotrichosporon oleaginosum]KLT43134.1 hypothetical protein CC85DRAFT_291736 [Cutaneotrichosporon oleaginosum]TXT10061.1 hypothetical protein COLE_03995 [Cutaneotrichosporon oleaginosum]
MPPQEALANTHAILSHLAELRDSLTDRVDRLSTAVARLRSQATELEQAVATGSPIPTIHPPTSEILGLALPSMPSHGPVVEMTRSMDGLGVETRILRADHRGLQPTNCARVAAAPKPVIVRGPGHNDKEEAESGQEALDTHTHSVRPPLPSPASTRTPSPPAPPAVEPDRQRRALMHPSTPRPTDLTSRGILVRNREGNAEVDGGASSRVDVEAARESVRERDREREFREAERLDRAIARYQRRHDESQREFHSAWEYERTRAISVGRVPNEHSVIRADALRRHVDNAHRLWNLMHQRSRLSVPPAEADAPLEMRHLLGTPTFRRGPLRPRRSSPLSGIGALGLDRSDPMDDLTRYYMDNAFEESDDEDWPRRHPIAQRLVRVVTLSDELRDTPTRRQERERAAERAAQRAAERAAHLESAVERERVAERERAAESARESLNDLFSRAETIHDDLLEIRRARLVGEGPSRADRQARADDVDRVSLNAPLPPPPRLRGRHEALRPLAPAGAADAEDTDAERILGDDGDAGRRALLDRLNWTVARLNATARRRLPDAEEDVLERVERARERVAELSRIQRDLEALRAGMRRGSDATVVPGDWPRESAAETETTETETIEAASARVAGAAPASSTGATSGSVDDEEKESGALSADTWPEAPNRARPRPYVSLLDL